MDPFGKHTSEELESALKRCSLSPGVDLDTIAGGAGAALSSGQLQLLTFGRTLLQPKRIIVMDEPTASVDMQTDNLVQQVVREAFTDSSVLLIAHRLETITSYCD